MAVLAARLPIYPHCFPTLSSRVHVKCCIVESNPIVGAAPILDGALAHTEWRAIPDIWRTSADKYGNMIALVDPHHEPPTEMTYTQVYDSVLDFAGGLRTLGILPEEHVALLADNSCRWLVADQGIMAMGAVNTVRGSRSSVEELLYILDHSDSVAIIVDTSELLAKLVPGLKKQSSKIKFILVLWGEKNGVTDDIGIPTYLYHDCIAFGRKSRATYGNVSFEVVQPDDVATIVYTSGTTGNPKGVMLTHANLLHQVRNLVQSVQPDPGDRFISLLPPWHMYERAAEYFIFTRGIQQVYTNIKYLKEDMKVYPAHYLVAVPLVYETLYSGIMKQLSAASAFRKVLAMILIKASMQYMEFKRIYQGKALASTRKQVNVFHAALEWSFAWLVANVLQVFHVIGDKLVFSKIRSAIGISKSGISGGGSLPAHVDKFFEVIGITLLNGYGLTEASPVVAARALPDNVLGTVGRALPDTELKVVDLVSNKQVENGIRGLVMARGPQVMKAYYKNPDATSKALDANGWLNTGDLGWLVPHNEIGAGRRCGGMLVLEGRAKDTIVLSTGENVEPGDIEEAALRSELIQQIMIFGQDQRRIGALIVPNRDAAAAAGINKQDELMFAIRQELNICLSQSAFQIASFSLVDEAFSIENGLMTPTMKLRRDAILSKYRSVCSSDKL